MQRRIPRNRWHAWAAGLILGITQVFDDQPNLAAEGIAFEVAQPRQVELIHQHLPNEAIGTHVAGLFLDPGLAGGRRPRRRRHDFDQCRQRLGQVGAGFHAGA